VFTYGCVGIARGDGQKMLLHSGHKSSFGLSDILFLTSLARDAIYQIVAFAIDLCPGLVGPSCEVAAYSARDVDQGTVSAAFGVTTSLRRFVLVGAGLLVRNFGMDQEISKVFWAA
jgi:hypothetical protein